MLKAENKYEEIIMKYVLENASESLMMKIESSGKTMAGCLRYVKDQARKQAVNCCAVIEDKEVFGWAMHFFEEDSIKENGNRTHRNPKLRRQKLRSQKCRNQRKWKGQNSRKL